MKYYLLLMCCILTFDISEAFPKYIPQIGRNKYSDINWSSTMNKVPQVQKISLNQIEGPYYVSTEGWMFLSMVCEKRYDLTVLVTLLQPGSMELMVAPWNEKLVHDPPNIRKFPWHFTPIKAVAHNAPLIIHAKDPKFKVGKFIIAIKAYFQTSFTIKVETKPQGSVPLWDPSSVYRLNTDNLVNTKMKYATPYYIVIGMILAVVSLSLYYIVNYLDHLRRPLPKANFVSYTTYGTYDYNNVDTI